MIDLRQMQQFVTVAEEGNFHRAAEKLFMTQPPLSMAIRKLEEQLGCLLLERKHKSFDLTPSGKVLLREAKQLLSQTEDVVRQVREIAEGVTGHLRISFVGSALYGRLPEAIRLFRKSDPGIKLELRMATSRQQHEMLIMGETDIAVLNEVQPPAPGIEAKPFEEDRLCMALPAGHALAKPGTTLTDLKNEPFIIWPRSQGKEFYDRAIALCRSAGFSPEIAQEAHQMQVVLSLVAVEAGVAIIPESMRNFRQEEITYLSITDGEAVFPRFLLKRSGDANAAVVKFLKVVAEMR